MVHQFRGYSEAEWQDSAGHYPLRDRPPEDMALLHRHWIWANLMREHFDRELASGSLEAANTPALLATPGISYLFLWYALLWVVIEALLRKDEGRSIDIRGAFRRDVDEHAAPLRQFRNAVLHVSRSGEYHDARLVALVSKPDAGNTLRRIHAALGRLFLEEFARRKDGGDSA